MQRAAHASTQWPLLHLVSPGCLPLVLSVPFHTTAGGAGSDHCLFIWAHYLNDFVIRSAYKGKWEFLFTVRKRMLFNGLHWFAHTSFSPLEHLPPSRARCCVRMGFS